MPSCITFTSYCLSIFSMFASSFVFKSMNIIYSQYSHSNNKIIVNTYTPRIVYPNCYCTYMDTHICILYYVTYLSIIICIHYRNLVLVFTLGVTYFLCFFFIVNNEIFNLYIPVQSKSSSFCSICLYTFSFHGMWKICNFRFFFSLFNGLNKITVTAVYYSAQIMIM